LIPVFRLIRYVGRMKTEAESAPSVNPERRHDLDWLRIFAILLLHVFHVGMAFNSWGWHIKNPERLPWLDLPMGFLHQWRMPLLFLISGIGTTFALRSRRLGGFIKERHRRLLWPLVFGMLVVVPPQVFYERLFQGGDFESYWTFYRTVFQGVPYPQGNTTWHHLWFVAYLFVFSLVSVPLLAWFASTKGKRGLESLRSWLAVGYRSYLPILPLAVIQISLRPYWPTHQNLVADWANFSFQLFHFWCGLLIAAHPAIWARIEQLRRISLGAGLTTLAALLVDDVIGIKGGYAYPVEYTLLSGLTWFWIMAVMGYGKHYLNYRNRVLRYANEGIYPFYILHQTVIVVIGYYLVSWPLGPTYKFLGLTFLSFGVTLLLYEMLIRRCDLMRVCFGLKPAAARHLSPEPEPPAKWDPQEVRPI
jgi:glucans biosynthesis protein C